MSIHLALPQQGHMEQLYHLFYYLNKYHNSELILDPSDKVIDQDEFERQYLTSGKFFHVSGNQYLPPNVTDPRGLGFVIKQSVDTDHSGYTFT